jgi:hypothetical protein
MLKAAYKACFMSIKDFLDQGFLGREDPPAYDDSGNIIQDLFVALDANFTIGAKTGGKKHQAVSVINSSTGELLYQLIAAHVVCYHRCNPIFELQCNFRQMSTCNLQPAMQYALAC